MSWITEPKRTWAEWTAIQVLKVGPLPRHMAIIMDGNRRFARLLHKDTLDGHIEGFKKLTEVLSWCRDLEINEVTAYAFSIENFKRSKSEVDGLMKLMEEKFELLLEEKDTLKEYGVCVRIIGNLELLSEKLRKLSAQVILTTKQNTKCFLNVAIAYTSREEILSSISKMKSGIKNKQLVSSDINEYLFEECLHTAESRTPPDLLIRTSGEVRLSDFLLWQTSFTHLFFTKVLWPELSIWHFLAAIFHFQRYHHKLVQFRKEAMMDIISGDSSTEGWLYTDTRKERVEAFLNDINETKYRKLNEYLRL